MSIVAVYKPKGKTSHDVINEIRKLVGEKKVGHAGTLDPLASGILVVGVGREATKRLGLIQAQEKEYHAVFRLGEESATDDAEGEKTEYDVRSVPTAAGVKKCLSLFIGILSQVPPQYSAVKKDGVRAYRYARRGVRVELTARKAHIHSIELTSYAWPFVSLTIVTGSGVYVRALARDIGRALGTGAYVSELERVRVGAFTKESAIPMSAIREYVGRTPTV